MATSRRCGGMSFSATPRRRIVPSSIDSKPAIMFSSVDFPQPLGPSSARISPASGEAEPLQGNDIAKALGDPVDLEVEPGARRSKAQLWTSRV